MAKNETPRDRFLRLAPARVAAALKRIALIGNLTGAAYEWSPDEAKQVNDALADAVNDLKRKFERTTKSDAPTFEFAQSKTTKPKAA